MQYPKGADEVMTERYITGVYKYEYRGKMYTYRYKYVATPPDTETLYFKKNPAKATNITAFGNVESWEYIFVWSLVICFIVNIVYIIC